LPEQRFEGTEKLLSARVDSDFYENSRFNTTVQQMKQFEKQLRNLQRSFRK